MMETIYEVNLKIEQKVYEKPKNVEENYSHGF